MANTRKHRPGILCVVAHLNGASFNDVSGLMSFTGALAALLIAILSAITPAHAVQPHEVLDDPVLEERARKLSAGLRCLVCQNQNIDESDAPLARDLRRLVRERLQAGDTDAQVTTYLVERYGEFVLLRPPFALHTLLLWLAPLFVLICAIWVARRTALRGGAQSGSATTAPELSESEKKRLNSLLARSGETSSSRDR